MTRHVTRWTPHGGDADAVAKQSVALLTAFPGTLGLYQGEELGQVETDIQFEELRDLGYVAFWPEIKGRDGARTPMVWDTPRRTPASPTRHALAAGQGPAAGPRRGPAGGAQRLGAARLPGLDRLPEGAGRADARDDRLPGPARAAPRDRAEPRGQVLTCLFNLGERPLTLDVAGEALPVGPIPGS